MDMLSHQEWERLSPEQRIAYCHDAATDAEGHAYKVRGEVREIYLRLADHWRDLAQAIAREAA